jgi:hypothetical protein
MEIRVAPVSVAWGEGRGADGSEGEVEADTLGATWRFVGYGPQLLNLSRPAAPWSRTGDTGDDAGYVVGKYFQSSGVPARQGFDIRNAVNLTANYGWLFYSTAASGDEQWRVYPREAAVAANRPKITFTYYTLRDDATPGDSTSLPASPQVVISVSGSDAMLSWKPVTQSIGGCQINVSGYFIFKATSPDDDFEYLGYTSGTSFTHSGIVQSSPAMFYHIVAFTGPPERVSRTSLRAAAREIAKSLNGRGNTGR